MSKSIINHMRDNKLSTIVSPSNRFVFMKIHKVAGTSIYRRNLQKVVDTIFEGKSNPVEMENWFDATIDEELDSYFKFTFVRNPWDRTISNFIYCQMAYNSTNNFDDFLSILENKDCSEPMWKHICPCHDYFLHEEKKYVDFIGRFENLNKDWSYVAEKIGLKGNKIGHHNATDRRPYKEYYNKKRVQRVADVFKKEIEYLNYEFN